MATKQGKMARAFRRAFKASGLSMKRLAEQSGVGYFTTWSFYSRKDSNPRLSTLEKWAAVLGVKIVED